MTIEQPQTGGTIAMTYGRDTKTSGYFDVWYGDSITLSNTPATDYLFNRYIVGGVEQISNTVPCPDQTATTITASFTMADVLPTFTPSVAPVKLNQAVSDGLYIKGLTRIKADILNAAAVSPKTIASYNITIPGYGTASASTFTTGDLTSTGSITISYSVTDSGGYSVQATQTIYVRDYTAPGLSFQCARCHDALMADDPMGTYIKYKASTTYTDVDGNAISSVQINIGGTVRTIIADNTWRVIDNYTLLPENSANATVTATDKFESTSMSLVIASANYAFYLSADGTAIGFGKATTYSNSVEIAPNRTLYIGNQTLADYINSCRSTDYVGTYQQTLDSTQQAQARTNIGLGDAAVATIDNTLLQTAAGYVLDARKGRELSDAIATALATALAYNNKVDVSSGITYSNVNSSSAASIVANSFHCYTFGRMCHLELTLRTPSQWTGNEYAWRARLYNIPIPVNRIAGIARMENASRFTYALWWNSAGYAIVHFRFVWEGTSIDAGDYVMAMEYIIDDEPQTS